MTFRAVSVPPPLLYVILPPPYCSDPAAELQVARKKISDLESLNRHIQTEVCVNITLFVHDPR